MWEGMDEPLDRGQLGGHRPVGRCPTATAATCRARPPGPTWTRSSPTSSPPPARGVEAGLRPDRGARRARLPAVVVPLAGLQPAHRRVRRRRWRTGCASRSRSSTPSAPSCPTHVPVTVRISATDWMPDGNTERRRRRDRARLHRARRRRHRRLVRPGHQGREAGVRPLLPDAVRRPDPPRGRRAGRGRRSSRSAPSRRYDDVNSILLAGRADLCALGRTHLYDPQWTLHAAAEQDYAAPAREWPLPWQAGRRRAADLAHRQDPAAAVAAARRRRRTTSTCAGRPARTIGDGVNRRRLTAATVAAHRAPRRVDGHRRRGDLPQHRGRPGFVEAAEAALMRERRAGRLLPGRPPGAATRSTSRRPLFFGQEVTTTVRLDRARAVVDDLRVRGLGRGVRGPAAGRGPPWAATSPSTSTGTGPGRPTSAPWPAEWVQRLRGR